MGTKKELSSIICSNKVKRAVMNNSNHDLSLSHEGSLFYITPRYQQESRGDGMTQSAEVALSLGTFQSKHIIIAKDK